MKIAVIGAGVAGLAAARQLQQSGHQVTVFEKSGALGGRVATRRIGPYTFDTGATAIAPRSLSLGSTMLSELDQTNLVEITKPVWVMEFGRVSPGDVGRMALKRYTYKNGINQLAKLLAEGLEIRLNSLVEEIEPGSSAGVLGEQFDRVILAVPAPQSAAILKCSGLSRPLAAATYRSCLTALLAYEIDTGAKPYHALVEPEQRSPVIWISFEHLKSPDRAPQGHSAFVVQFGATYSKDHYDDSDAEVMREAAISLARILGPEWTVPASYQVKRWRYAQPEQTADFDAVNPPGSSVLVAGDGLTGPRVELAFESGIAAARRILEES